MTSIQPSNLLTKETLPAKYSTQSANPRFFTRLVTKMKMARS